MKQFLPRTLLSITQERDRDRYGLFMSFAYAMLADCFLDIFNTMRITSIHTANDYDDDVLELPYFEFGIPAGFPSPAQDYMQSRLDLAAYLVKNKEATFYMRVEGERLEDFLVFSGDVLVVDRSYPPHDGSMVIAVVEGELVLRRYRTVGTKVFLTLDTNSDPLELTTNALGEPSVEIWGTVTFVIHDVS